MGRLFASDRGQCAGHCRAAGPVENSCWGARRNGV